MEHDDSRAWAYDLCISSQSTNPSELLEELMADNRCVAFGPIHHFIDGAALLTSFRNAQGAHDKIEGDLSKLADRSSCVPGAACANWGVCGAAASAGMAYSIICENGPLKAEGWSDDQRMVAEILIAIADAGAPRCCKRDSRIAVSMATDYLNGFLDTKMEKLGEKPVCTTMEKNTVCLGDACPYHPAHAQG